jgi:hypothetical protein
LAAAHFSSFSPGSDTACSRVYSVQPLPDAPDSVLALLETVLPELDCPPCAPLVSLALYAHEGERWLRRLYQPVLTNAGGFGAVGAAPQVADIGGAKYALIFRWGATGQGYTEAGITIFVNDQTGFQKAFSLPTDGNNAGTCGAGEKCWSYTSAYAFAAGKDSTYKQLIITTTGTRPHEGRITAADARRIYRFDGHSFVLE